MKTEYSAVLVILLALACGTWLYGYAFVAAVGFAWILGYCVKR